MCDISCLNILYNKEAEIVIYMKTKGNINLTSFFFYLLCNYETQARGHQRSPSDTQAFRQRTKRDAENELQQELQKLTNTAPENRKEEFTRQFEGFANLFKRFLEEEGPSLEWDRIQKLPENAVCNPVIFIYNIFLLLKISNLIF